MYTSLLILAGCVKTASGPGTGTDPTDTTVADLVDIDAETLPQGESPCRPPELAYVHTAIDGDTIHVDTSLEGTCYRRPRIRQLDRTGEKKIR